MFFEVAAKKDKSKSEQSKHERILLWLWDELAVNCHSNVSKIRCASPALPLMTPSCLIKIADWFIQNARAKPTGCVISGINQIGRSVANANLVGIGVVHKKTADGSARASDGDCRRVGSITAKKSSHLNRLDV